ncbi:MAG: diguanylate cyclase [Steroidobacteraceae bacterium]|nr:diguanylate cyclase [Steroidobacteraceae bacterium]MCC7200980.1 diguanylate cyclase [Gammaproteobacteria bacterium]
MSDTLPIAQLEAALDAMPAGVLLVAADPALTISFVNRVFRQNSPAPVDRILGHGLRQWTESESAGGRGELRLLLRMPGWSLREILLVPLLDDTGATARWLGVLGDLTEAGSSARLAAVRTAHDDPVTLLHSRAAFDGLLASSADPGRRQGRTLTLFIAELDAFERYSEVFGRKGAEACLRQVARTFAHCFRRASDVTGRWDDHAVAAFTLELDPTQAAAHAARVLERVRDLALHHPRSGTGRYVTLSVGVVTLGPESAIDAAGLGAIAAEALVEAQQAGGDAAVQRCVDD